MEYLQLIDNDEYEREIMPYKYYFEVDDEREVVRAIEFYHSGEVLCFTEQEFYADVVEIVPIPKVEELNQGVWSDCQEAVLISKEIFENQWNKSRPISDL